MAEEQVLLNTDKWIDNYAIVRVNDSDLAKDLVQDTFLKKGNLKLE